MKYFNKFILAGFAALLVMACEAEGPQLIDDENQSEATVPVVTEITDPFFNVLDLENARIGFSLGLDGEVPVERVEVYQAYNGGEQVLVETITDFPADFSIEGLDAVSAAGLNREDLEAGDNFLYTFRIYAVDGREFLTGNSFTAPVACASTIPAGAYSAVSGGLSTDACPPTNPVENLTYDVTLTEGGAGEYVISDFSAGVYQEWYGACYGYTFETEATLNDVCNTISFSGEDGFGGAVSGSGTYNPETGVITYEWENEFGDTGTVTLTPE